MVSSFYLNAQTDTLRYVDFLNKRGLPNIESSYSYKKAIVLIALWDSLYPKEKANLYANLSASRWEKILKFNIREARKYGDEKLALRLSYPLSIIYHRQTKYDLSTPILIQFIKHKSELSSQNLKEAYSRLEISYIAMGQFSDALKVRRIRLNYGFVSNLWELYKGVGLFEQAIQDFKLFEKFPVADDFEKIKYYNSIAELYLNANQPDGAIFYFHKMKNAADYIIKQPNYTGKTNYSEYVKHYYSALARANISEGFIMKGKYHSAIPDLKKAIVLCKEIKEVDQKIIKWLDLAECYLALNKVYLATKYLDSSKTYMEGKRMLPFELKLLKLRASCNQRLGDKKAYVKDFLAYLELKDSVLTFNQKNQSTLLLMNVDIEHQKMLLSDNNKKLKISRQAQEYQKNFIIFTLLIIISLIAILILLYKNYRIQVKSRGEIARRNTELIAKGVKISQQAKEKELLIKEIHHRVKNNLQVVYSLINLQKRRVENESEKEKFSALQNRIQSMLLLHQSLYLESDLDDVVAKVYIQNLVNHLSAIFLYETIELKIQYEIDEIKLQLDKAFPIGLIINEAVSNVFKYAFENRKTGVLLLRFVEVQANQFELLIQDDGIGFGSSDLTSTSLGIQLINSMAKQLKATHSCISNGHGTHHQFNFKM